MTTEGVEDLWKIPEYQKKFVETAVALLKSGGTMTYSTCTFNSSENEEMVSYILSQHPSMKLVPIDINFGVRPTKQGPHRRAVPACKAIRSEQYIHGHDGVLCGKVCEGYYVV